MPSAESAGKDGHPSSNAVAPQLQTIPIDRIDPSPFQVRQSFDEASLRELADSMQQVGLLQPIAVRPAADRFQLVFGERRLRAAKLLGWTAIPALVEEVSDLDAALRGLVENEQHQDVNPLDRARGFKRLTDPPFNLTQEEIAKRLGLSSQSMVSRVLALLDEPPEIQEIMSRDIITAGHLRSLDSIQDKSQRIALAKEAGDKHWSVRETEKRVQRATKGGRPRNAELAPSGSSSIWEFLQPLLRFLRVGLLLERIVRRVLYWVSRFTARRYEKAFGSGPTHAEPTHPKKAA